jgi:hypothetical protein
VKTFVVSGYSGQGAGRIHHRFLRDALSKTRAIESVRHSTAATTIDGERIRGWAAWEARPFEIERLTRKGE